jgi:hypothetical protein
VVVEIYAPLQQAVPHLASPRHSCIQGCLRAHLIAPMPASPDLDASLTCVLKCLSWSRCHVFSKDPTQVSCAFDAVGQMHWPRTILWRRSWSSVPSCRLIPRCEACESEDTYTASTRLTALLPNLNDSLAAVHNYLRMHIPVDDAKKILDIGPAPETGIQQLSRHTCMEMTDHERRTHR